MFTKIEQNFLTFTVLEGSDVLTNMTSQKYIICLVPNLKSEKLGFKLQPYLYIGLL